MDETDCRIIQALEERFFRKMIEIEEERQGSQCSQIQPLFDATGKEYRVRYETIPTSLDGKQGALASNLPDFSPNQQYIDEFQARDLGGIGESSKIRKIARNLDPTRMLVASADPTIGAPIVWSEQTELGDWSERKHYVLAGNGRTIAFLLAPEDKYREYVSEAIDRWGNMYLSKPIDGFRNLLVRHVFNVDGSPLSLDDAIRLAGASQESTAARETPLRQALSRARAMGIKPSTKLGEIENPLGLTVSNIQKFISTNQVFMESVYNLLPDVVTTQLQNVDEKTRPIALDTISSVMVGAFLPVSIIAEGFADEKEEKAIISVLPAIGALSQKVKSDKVFKEFNIIPQLESSKEMLSDIRFKTYAKAVEDYKIECEEQIKFPGVERDPTCNLSPLGVAFGLYLKRMVGTCDPSKGVKDIVKFVNFAIKYTN